MKNKKNVLTTSERKRILDNLINNMVYVEGGTFIMGSDNWADCNPKHEVKLESFSIGKFEVTQEEWLAVMGYSPACEFKGEKLPVECISWNESQEFINVLNKITGMHFRLPNDSEWEFAARGGIHSHGYKYSGSNNLDDVAWYGRNSGDKTHEVGLKNPNELGIFDMTGNVWEMCQNFFIVNKDYFGYPERGGCCGNGIYDDRVSVTYRSLTEASDKNMLHGFRLAL